MTRKLNATLIALLACAAALAVAMLAGVPTLDGRTAGGDSVEADPPVETSGNAFRRGLALPYFSFARGVRRVGG